MRRIVAAPAFALHICFSFFMYFSHAHVPSPQIPALDPRLPEDVAAFENFEVLSDWKKKKKKKSVLESVSSRRRRD